ncbi:PRA1 family protein A1-like protein [Tanacetum coccineum]
MTNIVPAPPTDPPKALDGSRGWGIQTRASDLLANNTYTPSSVNNSSFCYRTNYFLMILFILGLGFLRRPLAIVAALSTALTIAFLNDRSGGESSKISSLHQVPWTNERPLENKELNTIIGTWFTLWRD